MRPFPIRPGWLLGLILFGPAALGAVEFTKEIRPILERHCLECHGPKKQKSGLRLDLRAAAMKGGSGGPVIVAGKSAASSLIEHVSVPAGDERRMPPEGPGLDAKEIERLRTWIDVGAPWPDAEAGTDERLSHWAWQPLSQEAVAVLSGSSGHPVDVLLEKRLAGAGLAFSPEADRATLIRRLSFDLHGLPPSPERVEAFMKDTGPGAYEKLVDAMLASPAFGERFARHWLDLAHYADTHGFERDQRRPHAWRYRDYVIASLNADKPYPRFLREQIAGDVLWPQDPDAVVATGFLAAGPWDFVGQVETRSDELRRSARALDLDDMVTQVMSASVGITVNCARCHDHKLDPVSQEEYYRLWSVFAGVKRGERVVSGTAQKEYDQRLSELTTRRNAIDHALSRLEGKGISLADLVGGGNGTGSGKYRQGIDPRSGVVQTRDFGDLANVKVNQFTKTKLPFIDGVFIPDGQGGKAAIPVSSTGLTVTGLPTTSRKAWDAIRNGPVGSQHSPEAGGIDFTKDGHSLLGLHANAGITFDLDAIRRATGEEGLRLSAKLGYFGAAGGSSADAWVFVDGVKAFEARGLRREDGLRGIDLALPATARFLTLVSGDGGNGYGHDQVGFGDARLLPDPPRSADPAAEEERSRLTKERETITAALAALGAPPKVYAVVSETAVPEVRILRRGDPESPVGEPLPPGTVSLLAGPAAALGDLSTPEGARRAALAEWITHPDNVLTRRVIVNRLWQWVFGQGLVATPSDFGLGGDRPSHPELIDWLAAEFGRNGGSLKATLRLLLTSRAYRQDSRYPASASGIAVDAGNRLLWRQNPRRIEAEAVRDAVLAVSGKLNPASGGAGFEDFTYEEAYAPIYRYVTADRPELWRRSIYRYLVRTTPSRFLTTLDCPDPANLTPKRNVTTTPLQSLALYNNDFMLRQARYFAERLEKEGGDPVARAYALACGRAPSPAEHALATDFIRRESLFAFCRALFNANEFVYVD
jgi:mono/diheme cytochrome c family protein